jgi:chromosomal replication initiator protein
LLANKEKTQEEFFHTFNTLYNAGAQIVLSSDSPPVEIPTLQERLVSRFSWGLVTLLETPCYETRVAILKRKARERGRELPDEVARFLAERIETNVRELEGAVNRLLGFAALSGQELSLPLVRQCLRELFAIQRGQPTIDDILRVVTTRYGVKLSDLQSRRRTNAIVVPRQVGMYLARRITRMSLEEIGHYFGGRDHSTVLYAIEKVGRLSREDEKLRTVVTELLLELQGPSVS